jgi:hypothetical protein
MGKAAFHYFPAHAHDQYRLHALAQAPYRPHSAPGAAATICAGLCKVCCIVENQRMARWDSLRLGRVRGFGESAVAHMVRRRISTGLGRVSRNER